MFGAIVCFLRLLAIALLVVTLAACQAFGARAPTPTARQVAAPSTAAPTGAPQPVATVAPTGAPPATAAGGSVTPAVDAAPEQAVKAALLAQYPGAFVRIECMEGDFAAAAVAPLSGQHGFDAYLRQQNGAWAILTNGVDVRRESLIELGFPEDFCAMPPARATPLPDLPPASSPLVGPEWTLLVTGDLDRNGREDVIAFKPAPITPKEPEPGSQPNDVFVAFRELVVVERAADGSPAMRLFIDTHAVVADKQEIAQMPGASRPTSGVLAELRYPDRSLELRLIDDTGALGLPFLTVRYRDDAAAYVAEAAGARPPLSIGALTISPSEPAPPGPESGPSARQVQAGAIVTLSIPVQGARSVRFFADSRGESGHFIGGSSIDLSGDRAEFVWTVPEGAGQLALYAQALDDVGGVVSSAQVIVGVTAPGSSEHDLPEALLRAYYEAINAKDYARAYGYWENPPNPTLDEFAQGYGDTASVAVALGQPMLQGAAGSQYARIPIVLAATSTAGHLTMLSGCYVARQTNADSDTSSHGGKWFLYSATIQDAPSNVATKLLLAKGCQE